VTPVVLFYAISVVYKPLRKPRRPGGNDDIPLGGGWAQAKCARLEGEIFRIRLSWLSIIDLAEIEIFPSVFFPLEFRCTDYSIRTFYIKIILRISAI
jgi:hypothetical protein